MTIPYALRLICVCLASFAIVFSIAGLLVSLAVPMALRAAERMRSDLAAGFTLALRLLPATFAALTVGVVCLPSYIRFEQRAEQEDVGSVCLALAVVTAFLFMSAVLRTVQAWRRSAKASMLLALTGVVRPQVVISEAARNALTETQLAMAVQHEKAHAHSGDNLKRLLILLAPGAFPLAGSLEKAWKRFAEWSADDRAAAGDPQRAVSLAEALVRVAKLGTRKEPELVTSFLASEHDLETRVERLLNPGVAAGQPYGAMSAAAVVSTALVVSAMIHPAFVHRLLERLIH
jgi:hypothetical protein